MKASRMLLTARRFSLGILVAGILFVLLLALGEAGLRVAGYGHATGFWREETDAAGARWVRENPHVTAPFFSAGLRRFPQPFRISKEKPSNTVRIFVLGSSAAMGDPEASFGMSRMLEKALSAAVPAVHFEVINAAITAVNSNVVRKVAADCAALSPDLYVVYEGNNEVIGPFGPGTVFTKSLQSPTAVHLSVALRSLRLGQWLGAKAARQTDGKAPATWGGMEMFLGQQLQTTDARLEGTRELFRQNLADIVEAGKQAGAAVILGTVLTNERDFAPFLSARRTDLVNPGGKTPDALEESAKAAMVGGDWMAAERQWNELVSVDPHFAEAWYQLGKVQLHLGRSEEAARAFGKARDEDLLRFRTDSRFNEIIRESARLHGARLVDLEREARKVSKEGIVGDELLYEHVHLSFRGTYWAVSQLFGEVVGELKKRGVIPGPTGALISIDEMRRRLGYTVYDQSLILSDLSERVRKPPFTAQSDQAARSALYAKLTRNALEALTQPGAKEGVFSVYESALRESPGDWVLLRNFGMALVSLGHPEQAEPHLLKAWGIIPDDADLLYSLALCFKKQGKSAEAKRWVEALKANSPDYPGLENVVDQSLQP